jgi:hypothetical protein
VSQETVVRQSVSPSAFGSAHLMDSVLVEAQEALEALEA